MWKLLLTYALIVGALLYGWQASAQLTETGFGGGFGKSSGGGGPVLTYVGPTQSTAPVSGSTQTFSSAPFGAAFANRRIIVVILESVSYSPISAVTIGTVSATVIPYVNPDASYNGQVVFAYADVPTGTSGNVVITGGATAGDDANIFCNVYTVDKSTLSNPSPTTNPTPLTTPGTTVTTDANASAGSFIIAALSTAGTTGVSGVHISASTETMTLDGSIETSAGGNALGSWSLKSGSGADSPANTTFSWSGSAQAESATLTWR